MVLGPALLGAATAMLLASVGRRSGRGAEPFYAPDAPAAPPASGLPPAAAQQAPLAAAAIAESATRLSEGLERAGACESVMACDKWFARLLALSDEAAWMSRGDRRARFLELRRGAEELQREWDQARGGWPDEPELVARVREGARRLAACAAREAARPR